MTKTPVGGFKPLASNGSEVESRKETSSYWIDNYIVCAKCSGTLL